MMIAAVIQQTSLADSPPASAINAAAGWISDLLFGPLATVIAVIAIAWVGLAMLSGRIEIRRGASVALGCFLLFGARNIAEGLRTTSAVDRVPAIAAAPSPPAFAKPLPLRRTVNAFDPYAGSAEMRSGQ